ncbi:MAG: hypothetical protein QM761_03090 [Pseudoxanthomonas sp.]
MKPSLAGLLLLFAILLPAPHAQADAPLPWDDAKQLVLVVVPGWDANTGTLRKFERTRHGWKAVDAAADIAIGHSGAAWGLGLHGQQTDGPQKVEGDGRSPAGVFALGDAFGYARGVRTKLPYLALTASQYCVDVNASPLYNRIVDAVEVGEEAVKDSTEPMRRDLHADGDQRYREGFVIRHNPDNVPGKGSCIFAHLWKAPGESTTGCTAMTPATMDRLLGWLAPKKHPVFVLLPQAEYERLKGEWRLP